MSLSLWDLSPHLGERHVDLRHGASTEIDCRDATPPASGYEINMSNINVTAIGTDTNLYSNMSEYTNSIKHCNITNINDTTLLTIIDYSELLALLMLTFGNAPCIVFILVNHPLQYFASISVSFEL